MTDNERKEYISELRQLLDMCDFVDQYGDFIDADPYFNAVETVIKLLNEIRWIPVSEKLPETGDSVLVTYSDGEVGIIWSARPNAWVTYTESNNLIYPIAWMPLPEPYREDGE